MPTAIDDVRGFNRFFTRQIGLLEEGLAGSPFTLVEARLLYELSHSPGTNAAALARNLSMDKGHLSRVLARLRARGLLAVSLSPNHGRHRLLDLTEAGRAGFAALDRQAVLQVEAMLAPLGPAAISRLTEAMREMRLLLDREGPVKGETLLRPPRPGDLGWIAHRQAALYHLEYGWDGTFEGLLCEILADFVKGYDATREACWIAESDGRIAGSVFLVRGDDPATAKLRMLYVEPWARGAGVGRALVTACIARAREAGYAALKLWTNDILVAARRLYEAEGFVLVEEEPHHSFGHDLVGQTWLLRLDENSC